MLDGFSPSHSWDPWPAQILAQRTNYAASAEWRRTGGIRPFFSPFPLLPLLHSILARCDYTNILWASSGSKNSTQGSFEALIVGLMQLSCYAELMEAGLGLDCMFRDKRQISQFKPKRFSYKEND